MNRKIDNVFVVFSWTATLLTLATIVGIMGWLLYHASLAMGFSLFFDDVPLWDALLGNQRVWDGLWPAACGTGTLVVIAIAMAAPVGLGTAIYLAVFASAGWKKFYSQLVDFLAGIPSVIVGLFGFALLLFVKGHLFPAASSSLLLSACCLGILILPYIIKLSWAALESVPKTLEDTADALGISRWKQVWHLLIPSARRGIIEGVILAIGRAAEDTAVILFTGVVANAGLPKGLLSKFEALPFYIYYNASEARTSADLGRSFGAAIALIAFTFIAAIMAKKIAVRSSHVS